MLIYCSTLLSLCSLHIHNNKYKNIFLLIQLLCIYLYTEDYIINNKYVVYKHLYAQHPSKPILAPPAPPLPPPSPKSPGFCYSNVGRYDHYCITFDIHFRLCKVNLFQCTGRHLRLIDMCSLFMFKIIYFF